METWNRRELTRTESRGAAVNDCRDRRRQPLAKRNLRPMKSAVPETLRRADAIIDSRAKTRPRGFTQMGSRHWAAILAVSVTVGGCYANDYWPSQHYKRHEALAQFAEAQRVIRTTRGDQYPNI